MTAPFAFDPARLESADPPPVEVVNPTGDPLVMLCCDHAANAVPGHMQRLGLPQAELDRHIGWDIGAADVTRALAASFDAPAFLSGYSRLIIDCNRPLPSPTSIPLTSDGTTVPANQALGDEQRRLRAAYFFAPYHQAIAHRLDRVLDQGVVPFFLSIHSFTPVMNGRARPWQIGLLFEHDTRLVAPLHRALSRRDPTLTIGENEPYAIIGPSDYSVPVHAQARGLPHIEIELRQDLIATREGAQRWAALLHDALVEVMADQALRQIVPPR
ncbi:MAG: N-formylglutamate amidohydrolase [Alphaproteobacteria bacterium]|nr:N-formylglutamate amidohydrolase [Alphaproteobacteria bacterium]